jgi:DNA-directed RNA polymerase specialized sigma24 family protein
MKERSRRRDPVSAANQSRTAAHLDSTVWAISESGDAGDADIAGDFAWDCVLRLTRRQREVLIYRLVFGKTEAATAAVLCIAIGTVKVHFHRALKALRLCSTLVDGGRQVNLSHRFPFIG